MPVPAMPVLRCRGRCRGAGDAGHRSTCIAEPSWTIGGPSVDPSVDRRRHLSDPPGEDARPSGRRPGPLRAHPQRARRAIIRHSGGREPQRTEAQDRDPLGHVRCIHASAGESPGARRRGKIRHVTSSCFARGATANATAVRSRQRSALRSRRADRSRILPPSRIGCQSAASGPSAPRAEPSGRTRWRCGRWLVAVHAARTLGRRCPRRAPDHTGGFGPRGRDALDAPVHSWAVALRGGPAQAPPASPRSSGFQRDLIGLSRRSCGGHDDPESGAAGRVSGRLGAGATAPRIRAQRPGPELMRRSGSHGDTAGAGSHRRTDPPRAQRDPRA